jgi:hypothetical protein
MLTCGFKLFVTIFRHCVVYRLINFVFRSGTSTKRRWSDLINKKRAASRSRRRSVPPPATSSTHGRAAPERRRRRARKAVETLEEAVQGGEQPERNSDVDRGHEACKEAAAKKTAPKPQRKSA